MPDLRYSERAALRRAERIRKDIEEGRPVKDPEGMLFVFAADLCDVLNRLGRERAAASASSPQQDPRGGDATRA